MAQTSLLKARGLYTFPNSLSELPEGALVEARNVVIDREGVVSPRRGFQLYGDAQTGGASVHTKQLITYKGRILRHYSSRLEYDSNGTGTFSAFNDVATATTASISEVESGLRIKSVEANGNLYLTTSAGIKKISAANAAALSSTVIYDAGGIKALDGIAELNSDPGFFIQDSVVAYRVVWGYRDSNNNLILGAPSERIVVTNSLLSLLIADFNGLLTGLDTAAAADGGDDLGDTDYSSLRLSSNASAATLHTALAALCAKLDADIAGTVYATIAGTHSAPTAGGTTAELEDLQEFYNEVVDGLFIETLTKISLNAQTAGNFQYATESATVDVTFTIPAGVTTNYLYQIYRTPLTTSADTSFLSDFDPGDEMQLAYEGNPTSGEITAKSITVQDITPESFLGANLYTNANSGEGIAQANEVPPLAKDIAVFKNTTFYANTQTKQRKQISLLSASDLTNRTLTITLVGGAGLTYTFRDAVKTTQINCVAGADHNAVAADYFDLYSANDELHYRVWFDVGGAMAAPAGGAGITLLEVEITNTDTAEQVAEKLTEALNEKDEFSVTYASNVVTVVNTSAGTSSAPTENVGDTDFTITIPSGKTGAGEDAVSRYVAISNADTPAQAVDETARSLVGVINKQASSPVIASYVSGPNDVPGAIVFEAKQLGTAAVAFTVSDTTIGAKFNPALPTSGTTIVSDNEISPNRIYYSKYQQPEAVPTLNYIDVGPKDQSILRIVPLRDSLFIMKEDGIYRLSGDRGSFSVTAFDNSTKCVAPDTASVLNNQIYMFATQGIVTVSDTGTNIISRQIENLLLPLTSYDDFISSSFSLGYESDRAFMLWTVSDESDELATQCFRYNVFTSTWTVWDSSKTCGVVNSADDKLYLGAGDTNYIEQERKSFSRLDHADRSTALTLSSGGLLGGTVLALGGLFGVEIGDVIVQTQYLTIAQFNRLLKKLDRDANVADADYYSTLAATAGDRLSSKLTALVTKLNADTGVADSDYTSTGSDTFTTLQTEFNAVVTKLNSDTGVQFSNYPQSTGTVTYEALVTAINQFTNRITIQYSTPFIFGSMEAFKHIESTVVWAPQHFGDPSITKQVREATIMFEDSAFTNATAYYSSDLSTGFQSIPFSGEGSGTFGSGYFGRGTFGGEGTSKPLRTLVPREKQRCRFINCKFNHKGAFEQYAIFGISFTYEGTSSRGYR